MSATCSQRRIDDMYDRGQLGRELVQMTEELRQMPAGLQRSAALRGLEPARHSDGE